MSKLTHIMLNEKQIDCDYCPNQERESEMTQVRGLDGEWTLMCSDCANRQSDYFLGKKKDRR